MCGRFIRKLLADDAIKHFELVDGLDYFDKEYQASDEVFPTDSIFAINKHHLPENIYWTITVRTRDGQTFPAINAKAENVLLVDDFKEAFLNDRVLIPATGLYEWQQQADKKKLRHEIWFDEPIFAFGGLAAPSEIKGEIKRSGVIITTTPNEIFAEIHNTKQRQAVVIRKEDYDLWLDPETPVEQLRRMTRPLSSNETHFKISPNTPVAKPKDPMQGSLFG